MHRGNRYGLDAAYLSDVLERICLIVQIESRAGLEHVSEIAAVDGVDGILFGPADLAADLGHLGNATHAEVVAAIGQGVERVRAAGKFPGMSTADPKSARSWFASGCRFVFGGDLQLLTRSAHHHLEPLQDIRIANKAG